MANPTTNYGFVLPTSTDLVTDLPADFDVALQGVDTRLKALQPGTTLGDIAYSSATANTNTRLGIGTTGQVLTVSSGVPAWATVAAGGGMTSIANGSLSGALSLTSISGSYKDLVLVLRGVTQNDDIKIILNADTGSNYAWVQIASNLTSPGRSENSTILQMTQPGILTGNSPNHMTMTIHDYTNTTSWKGVTAVNGGNPNGTKSAVWTTGVYASTSAITGISTLSSFTGGTYILYGVN